MSTILHRGKKVPENGLETTTEEMTKASAKKTRRATAAMNFLTAPLLKKITKEAREFEATMIDLSAPLRTNLLLSFREVLKHKLTSDRDMWLWIKKWLHSVVDDLWAEITVEVDAAVDEAKQIALGDQVLDVEELAMIGNTPRWGSPEWMRAKILYHFLPYDKSIFGQMKDVFWWVLLALSLWPTYGVSTIFFTIVFFLITCKNPPDEFQLVYFILQFKGMQFISGGIICAFIGASKYYWCLQPQGLHSCDVDGPYLDAVFGCVDVLGSCVLVWFAFLLLPFSERAGGLRQAILGSNIDEKDVEPKASEGSCCLQRHSGRGGSLHTLLRWDLYCFIASCTFLVVLLMRDYRTQLEAKPSSGIWVPGAGSTKPNQTNGFMKITGSWHFGEALYWAKVLYALLSLPFSIFYIPVFQTILTHTVPTGFNENGACVVFAMCQEDQHETPDATHSGVEELTSSTGTTPTITSTATTPTDEPERCETEDSNFLKHFSRFPGSKHIRPPSIVFQMVPHCIIKILETPKQLCSWIVTYTLSIPGMLIRTPKTVMKALLGKFSKLFYKLPLWMMVTDNVQDRIHQLEKGNLEKQIQALSRETQKLKKSGDVQDQMHQLEKEKLEKEIQALREENQALKKLIEETEVVTNCNSLGGVNRLLSAQLMLIRLFLRCLRGARSS